MSRVAVIRLAAARHLGRKRAVGNADHPRLAIELEEHPHLTVLVRLADRLQPKLHDLVVANRNHNPATVETRWPAQDDLAA